MNIESLYNLSDSAYSKTDLNSGSLEKEDGDVDATHLIWKALQTVDDDKETHIIYYSIIKLKRRARSIRWFQEMRNSVMASLVLW